MMLKFGRLQILAILIALQMASVGGADELSPGESRPVGGVTLHASEEILSQRAPSFEAWRGCKRKLDSIRTMRDCSS